MNKNKIITFIFLILITINLILALIGLYNYLKVKYAKIEVALKEERSIEFNDKKKVSDFIININGKIINDYIIDSTKLGPQDIKFDFINDEGIKVNYKYTINIIDSKGPYIRLNNTYNVKKNSGDTLLEDIICVDNVDDNPNCYIEGEYDLKEKGEYNLTFKAEDTSKNISTKNFTLNVYEPSNKENYKPTYTYYKDVYNYHKKEDTLIGLDLSEWQGEVDFEKIKESKVEFVILRVGSSKGKNGEYFLDSEFIRNITEANKNNIPVGIYYYSCV